MVSSSSFMVGLIGGLLDFASATTMAINGGGSAMVNGYVVSGYGWAAVLALIGVLVVATAILSVTATGVRHLKTFSVLMALLGLIMAIMGTVASSGLLTGSSLIFGYGMVVVGLLMAINSVMMLRTPMPI